MRNGNKVDALVRVRSGVSTRSSGGLAGLALGVCEHLRESEKYRTRHRSDELCTIIGRTASSKARLEDEHW